MEDCARILVAANAIDSKPTTNETLANTQYERITFIYWPFDVSALIVRLSPFYRTQFPDVKGLNREIFLTDR
jgi:hypothetical protein